MKLRHVVLLVLFITLASATEGQQDFTFNYNTDNGLPSNYTYGMITDRHGYMWIATAKGVGCYNGYDFRVFNLTEDLPNEDVWQVYEDRLGRIWLGSISNEIGYIYNNKYHKAFLKNEGKTLYPQGISKFGNGIIFYTAYFSGLTQPTVCVAITDTIYKYSLNESMFGVKPEANVLNNKHTIHVLSTAKEQLLLIYNNCVYRVVYSNRFKVEREYELSRSFSEDMIMSLTIKALNENLLAYSRTGSSVFYLLNLTNGKIQKMTTGMFNDPENIEYISPDEAQQKFYVITKSAILQFDYSNGIKYVTKNKINNLISSSGVDGTKIRSVHNSGNWGNYYGTTTNGLYIKYYVKNHFTPHSAIDLHNFVHVGSLYDSVSFWWDKSNRVLMKINSKLNTSCNKYAQVTSLKGIIPYNKDSSLLAAAQVFHFINGTGNIIKENRLGIEVYSIIPQTPESYFAISHSGLYHVAFSQEREITQSIDVDKYNDMVYDSMQHTVWAYNYRKVFIHGPSVNAIIAQDQMRQLFGVDVTQNIVVDNKYQNIFFKGSNNITMYDPARKVFKELFPHVNLTDAYILLAHNKLIVAGRFGVLFDKISGTMSLSPSLLYHNVKNVNYKFIYGCDVIGNNLLLSTDKGTYTVEIPSDSLIEHSEADSLLYDKKFVLNYRDTIKNFQSGDTVTLDQNHRRLQFDVINPYGNGSVKYMYQYPYDSVWHMLNVNEINLPAAFAPGNYYGVKLKVYDDVWRSDELLLHVYIVPHWYQTPAGRKSIWLTSGFLFLLLVSVSALVTRKLVLNAAKKRSLRMELELKAIYAQINPHFIFNTLNSALLLVNKNKMEEAYVHISKFSRLLRGYIKASRNKLIKLSEEIANLKDYIELQQTRFKSKFDYSIIIHLPVNAEKIMIPSLLIQPFVENAINHGLLHKEDKGHLTLEFDMQEGKNEMICIIEDDGIGRKQSKEINAGNNTKGSSYGDLLIKDLVRIFNKYENMNIEIRYTDKLYPQTGTIVTIQIKNLVHAGTI